MQRGKREITLSQHGNDCTTYNCNKHTFIHVVQIYIMCIWCERGLRDTNLIVMKIKTTSKQAWKSSQMFSMFCFDSLFSPWSKLTVFLAVIQSSIFSMKTFQMNQFFQIKKYLCDADRINRSITKFSHSISLLTHLLMGNLLKQLTFFFYQFEEKQNTQFRWLHEEVKRNWTEKQKQKLFSMLK